MLYSQNLLTLCLLEVQEISYEWGGWDYNPELNIIEIDCKHRKLILSYYLAAYFDYPHTHIHTHIYRGITRNKLSIRN